MLIPTTAVISIATAEREMEKTIGAKLSRNFNFFAMDRGHRWILAQKFIPRRGTAGG
jgi:hypothetical protein